MLQDVSMIHIGTNTEEFKGEDKQMNKVRLFFELPDELMVFKEENGEQPRVMSEEFTLSLHKKSNLRKFLESWRGKGFTDAEMEDFDLVKLLGAPGMLTVVHDESGKYANVSSVAKVMKGMKCPKQINPTFSFGYEPFEPELLEQIPEWIADKIKTSVEYLEATGKKPASTTPSKETATDDAPSDEEIVDDYHFNQ